MSLARGIGRPLAGVGEVHSMSPVRRRLVMNPGEDHPSLFRTSLERWRAVTMPDTCQHFTPSRKIAGHPPICSTSAYRCRLSHAALGNRPVPHRVKAKRTAPQIPMPSSGSCFAWGFACQNASRTESPIVQPLATALMNIRERCPESGCCPMVEVIASCPPEYEKAVRS